MLSAVLFTAAVFRLPQWARAELHTMWNQFFVAPLHVYHQYQTHSQPRPVLHAAKIRWDRTRLHRRRNMHAKLNACDEVADSQKQDRYFYIWAA